MFEAENDNYKLYRVKQNRNCLARIDKYKTVEASVEDVANEYQESSNVTIANTLQSVLEPKKDSVEVLSFDENMA